MIRIVNIGQQALDTETMLVQRFEFAGGGGDSTDVRG